MLKNLHLKLLSLILATLFWVFVVSLENTFYKLPQELSVQVFNQAPELALASELETVRITVRAQDAITTRTLSSSDFEAYIDLRNVGAGTQDVPVAVTSRNPQVNVVRIEPRAIEVTLEPVREKIVALTSKITGKPASGFRTTDVTLLRQTVTVRGADSVLRSISTAQAVVVFDGTERQNLTKSSAIAALDKQGQELSGVEITPASVDAAVTIVEEESSKQVTVKAKTSGSLTKGTVKSIAVVPAAVDVTGSSDALRAVDFVQTEEVDLRSLSASGEMKAKLVLPLGVGLAKGQAEEVSVRVEITNE